MYKKISVSLLIILMVLISGCYPVSEDSANNSTNNKDAIINIIQNGHVNDNNEDDKLVTPCCLTYRRYGVVVETEIVDDLSDTQFSSFTTSNSDMNNQYLIVSFRFVNVTQQILTFSDNILSVTADDSPCEQIGNSYNSEKIDLLPHIETDLLSCYIIPSEYGELKITHKKYVDLGSIDFYVQENGMFTEDDLSTITNNFPLPETEFDNEYCVPVTSAVSDSYYHSEKSNIDYTIENTFDGDYSTCWQDGSDGDGLGETLSYSFSASAIHEVRIVNGSRKQSGSYNLNNRLQEVQVQFSLNDTIIYETEMMFSDDDSIEYTILSLDQPVISDSVSIIIKSVYNGSDYDDTCISEISFVSFKYTPLGLIILNCIEPIDKQVFEETEPTGEVYTRDNPRDIVGEDVPNLKEGDWIRVTGSADCYLTDDGKIKIDKFKNLGKYGLLISVKKSDGQAGYILEAPSVSDTGFEGQFSDRAPEGTYYGYRIHFNCKVTVVGRVGSYIAYSDGTPYKYICLSSDSKITDLEFYD